MELTASNMREAMKRSWLEEAPKLLALGRKLFKAEEGTLLKFAGNASAIFSFASDREADAFSLVAKARGFEVFRRERKACYVGYGLNIERASLVTLRWYP